MHVLDLDGDGHGALGGGDVRRRRGHVAARGEALVRRARRPHAVSAAAQRYGLLPLPRVVPVRRPRRVTEKRKPREMVINNPSKFQRYTKKKPVT